MTLAQTVRRIAYLIRLIMSDIQHAAVEGMCRHLKGEVPHAQGAEGTSSDPRTLSGESAIGMLLWICKHRRCSQGMLLLSLDTKTHMARLMLHHASALPRS